MLEYEKINVFERIDANESHKSKECDICHYWYLLDNNCNYEPYLCKGCHYLMQIGMNFNSAAVVSVKGNSYRIYFWFMTKTDAISLLNNSVLDNKGVL